MNRRTFNTTLLTIPFLSISTLFAGKEITPQWVKAKDQLPKHGQKIIMYGAKGKSSIPTLRGGTVVKDVWISDKNHYIETDMVIDFRAFMPKTFDPSIEYYSSGGLDVVTNKKWIKYISGSLKYSEYKYIRIGMFIDNMYWIPVNKEYPKTLPPFPKKEL